MKVGKLGKLGVVMDPIATLNPAQDTTVGMLDAARQNKWEAVYFTAADIWLRDGDVRGLGRAVSVDANATPWFTLGDARELSLSELDAILMRVDPPVDEAYTNLCHLLERVPGQRVFNRPASILAANEKVFAQRFAQLQPPTLISRDMDQIRAFVAEHKEAVVKPLNGMQGRSVFRVGVDDANADTIIEELTARGTRLGVVQALIPEYKQGDLRVLLIDGEPLPEAVLRVPPPGKLRANMAAGGSPQVRALDERSAEICAAVAPDLKAMGLFFVGLDIIGGQLTEINVTSPTGMRPIDAARGSNMTGSAQLLRALEAKVAAH